MQWLKRHIENSRRRWLSAALLLAMGLCARLSIPAQSSQAASRDLTVQVGPAFEIASSHGRTWFPTIHRWPHGEIMVAFGMNADAVGARLFSAYCISTDNGTTWSERYTMGNEAHDSGGWSPDPESDGSIWHLYTPMEPYPPGQSQQFHITLTKYWRGGRRVSIDRDATLKLLAPMDMITLESMSPLQKDYSRATEEISGFPFGPILHAQNGDLITPIYYKTQRDPRYYRLGMIRSSDEGRTWAEYSTIAALKPGEAPWSWMGKNGPCEAGLVRLLNGRLYTIYRTGSDAQMGQAWSSDDGQTWTLPAPLPFKGVAPRMRRLQSGVLACTFGRPGPVTIMFDIDGSGKHWSHVTPIYSGMSTRYNDFVEISPGKLLLVYDSVPYGWKLIPDSDTISKETVYGSFIQVSRR